MTQENLFSFAEAAPYMHLLYAGDLQPQKSADKRAIQKMAELFKGTNTWTSASVADMPSRSI